MYRIDLTDGDDERIRRSLFQRIVATIGTVCAMVGMTAVVAVVLVAVVWGVGYLIAHRLGWA